MYLPRFIGHIGASTPRPTSHTKLAPLHTTTIPTKSAPTAVVIPDEIMKTFEEDDHYYFQKQLCAGTILNRKVADAELWGSGMSHKRPLFTLESTQTVHDALKKMQEWKIGAIVVQDGKEFKGIFTERDYLKKVAWKELPKTTPLSEVLTAPVLTVSEHADAVAMLHLLTEKRFRHLPVVDDEGEISGLVSIGDLVKAVSEDNKLTIDSLTEYISKPSY